MLTSCNSAKDNDYFYNLDKSIRLDLENQSKVNIIKNKELEKYNQTHAKKYLLGVKYIELSLSRAKNDPLLQIPLVYELLSINKEEYDYITIICNFYLALYFEKNSPKLGLRYLDKAILVSQKTEKKYYLPHLYHAKGRWLYNEKKYPKAMFYFNKALQNYKKEDTLYIASMHNNFALCNDKLNNIKLAAEEINTGITILGNKKNLTSEELLFFHYMKSNQGEYYFKLKDYKASENIFKQEFDFYLNSGKHPTELISTAKILLNIYEVTHQSAEKKNMIDFFLKTEKNLKIISDKILVHKVLQKYYLKNDDLKNLKVVSKELTKLNDDYSEQSSKKLATVSDLLNNYRIKNINQKNEYKANIEKKKSLIIIISIVLGSIILLIAVSLKVKKKKKEKEILEYHKQKLESDIKLQKNKIENLQLNLNLKMETEKAFLENLKKIKKLKNIDIEQTLRDLFFKINNLIEIDKKNNELINESSLENKVFIEKVSKRFPVLTNKELKLCVYFKLNLSAREISLLENIAEVTATVYKAKIKAKIGLTKEINFTDFLNNI
jgi:hypothetical protein